MYKVGVVRSWYLPMSETFIYAELVHLKNVSPIVCTKKIMNLKRFPFNSIYTFSTNDELRSILDKQDIQLIHARFGTTGAELLDVKKKMRLPMLTSFHGFDLPSNRKSRKKYGQNLTRLFKEGDRFTVTSENMKKILESYGCSKEKIIVHHSGIDVDRFAYKKRTMPKNQPITLLSVGRLVEKKGMEHLIDAFYRVQKKEPNVSLRIVGDGPLRKKLDQQVKKYKIEKKVHFLGERSHDQVRKEMQHAHLFALASTKDRNGNQEGIPNVLKEAMACGLPVLSTKHAGIPELVQDGESGFLVPERDHKALAKRMTKLIQRPDKWGHMGKVGREKVEQSFNIDKQIRKLEKIYTTMIDGK